MTKFPEPTLAFLVWGDAKPRGSKVAGMTKAGKMYIRDSSAKSYPWMADVKRAAGTAMGYRRLLEGPLRLELDFYKPRPKAHYGTGSRKGLVKASAPERPISAPDVSKIARGTTDAMQGIVYRNDAQIVEEEHRKFYGEPAHCSIKVYQL